MISVDDEERFIRKKFKEYYEKNFVLPPERVSSREFGFGSWTKKIESRHFSFMNEKELNGYLSRNAPLYISYSIAYYKYPIARPIEKKEWLGGEIVFDIDANDVGEKCTEIHGKNWVCEKCMQTTKESALRLIDDFLIKDFGIEKKEIEINFSGNRGYHIHIKSGFEELRGYPRKEIADYVNGRGINYETLFIEKSNKRVVGPKPSDGGWKGRIASIIIDLIKRRELEKLVSKRTAKKFYNEEVIKSIKDGNWERVYISNRKKFFENFINKITKVYGSNVDEQVTMDTSKLIRLPDSIHGETGLTARRINVSELDKFNPFKGPIIFWKNQLKINVKECKEFILNDQLFGPYKNENIELPEYAAIYLICKKVAKLTNQ